MTAYNLLKFVRKNPRAILAPNFWLIRPVAFHVKRLYKGRVASKAVLNALGYHSHFIDYDQVS